MREGYKQTELGEIPNDWEIISLGKCINAFAGGTPLRSNSEFYTDGKIPWVKSGEVNQRNITQTEEHITEAALGECSAKMIEPNSLLVALYGATAGNVGMLRIKATSNQAVLAINSKVDYLTNEYVYHYLKQATPQLLNLTQGSGQPNLSKGIIENLQLPLPNISEQQKIADILSTIDEKIEGIEARISQTEELKKGLMQQLLTKGIGHKKFKNSELGEIPESWEVKALIDLSTNGICNGTFNDPKKVGSGFKFINVVNMYSGNCIDIQELSLLNIEKGEFEKNKVEYGDVFFTRSSLVAEGIAHCNVNLSIDEDITFDGHLMRVRPNQSIVMPQFLNYSCKTSRSRNFLISRGKTATMTTIGQKDIADLPIAIPPIEEQQKIVEIISTIEAKLDLLQAKKENFEELKKGLMQTLLTGKVRVKV